MEASKSLVNVENGMNGNKRQLYENVTIKDEKRLLANLEKASEIF